MYIAIRLVNWVINIAQVFLGIRFLLRLFGANSATPFVNWWYNATDPLLHPFRGVFPTEVIDGRYVFEFSTLFAMVAYAVIGYLIISFIHFIHDATHHHTHRTSVVQEP